MNFQPIMPVGLLVLILGSMAIFAIVQAVRNRRHPGWWHWLARLGMIFLLFAIALRPVPDSNLRPPAASGDVDVYFVVDTTSSMAAEDWDGDEPRLEGVREDIPAIAQKLLGARFSLVTFDAATIQRVPLTTDASALEQASAALNQEITYYSQGSSISEPVEFMEDLLEAEKEENPDRMRVVYYIGDGEQTLDADPESFESLAEYIDGGAVLGYGTKDGGPMKEFTGYDDGEEDEDPTYITDNTTGEEGISKIDTAALEEIADQMGVSYVHRDAESSVADAVKGIKVGNVEVQDGATIIQSPEMYWIFAIPFGLLALTELGALIGSMRELRRMKEASHGA